MKHTLSTFGNRLALDSGIGELMQDLGETLASGDENLCMLGGGQPAHIPEVDRRWLARFQELADDPRQVASVLGDYQPPGGDAGFRDSVAKLFEREFGWPITAKNVCITAGGQTAFFLLLNALAGKFDDGTQRKVLLPIVPEYIGYADLATSSDLYRAVHPLIEKIGDHEFKYAIDFDALEIDDSIAAICLSRPTNPSSNVVSDAELEHLAQLAEENDIPLIVDNAYGDPFPGVIFTDSTPVWRPSMVLTYSLSKLGLPGTRTGIVIASEEMVQWIASMNAISSLANNNVGQAMIRPMIDSGEIISISHEVIRPFYETRSRHAHDWLVEALDDSVPYRIHRSEGAFFLWLWLEGLPISSAELYQRLKKRGVMVISGHYFFFGLPDDDWSHRNECLRISFTTSEHVLRRGIEILADEINRLFAQQAT